MLMTGKRWSLAGMWAVMAMALSPASAGAQSPQAESMSSMGRLAAQTRQQIEANASERFAALDAAGKPDDALCLNDPRCPAGMREGLRDGTQSELSIAIDATGRHVVVGFNDFRGFNTNPISVSGYMYSNDGGRTFVDGGQLPVTTGTEMVGGTLLPQIFGDPDVKYLGECTFVYSSILLKKFGTASAVQTMGIHRSTDCGRTWEGPYEVAAASNPNGLVDADGNPFDAADKEFIDVDPDSGRIHPKTGRIDPNSRRLIMSWTNFGARVVEEELVGVVEIRTAISEDGGFTWPKATSRIVADGPLDGQASIPRFARGSNDVYVAWRRFYGFYGNSTAFARSSDGGLTWQPPVELSAPFLTQDMILGNDRSNTSPSMDVDRSRGRDRGTIYVVYPNNNSNDGSDIVFQKSTDRGVTFSAPIALNSRPGEDRPQWFPWVTVDDVTGRVSVFYYDQGIATSGHLSEISYLFSDDGGKTWEHPRPLTARPFKAGHGNDTSQPNLGDYNQAVARAGKVWFAFAVPHRPPDGFVDGQPGTQMTVPEAEVTVVSQLEHVIPHVPLQLRSASTSAPGGHADPGETISVRLPLFNYATNPLYAERVPFAHAWLSTSTRDVIVTDPLSSYGAIEPGETEAGSPFRLRLLNRFQVGTPIELELTVLSAKGWTLLRHTIHTGTPQATTLIAEDFETSGGLPAGWTSAHGAGATTVPWTTSNTFCGPSTGAFHESTAGSRWERLISPAFTVPADAEYVVVEFDICYNTEDDPILPTTAYDGLFLRVTDLTPGRTLRSVLVEAFEDEFMTGTIAHYPKHLPRNSDPGYFEDMSAWAGTTNGMRQRVRLRLPGMEGSTAQLRFEYTQDSIATCQDVRPGTTCGVLIDNVVVQSVVSKD